MTNPRSRTPGNLGRYASAATRAEPLIKPTVGDPGVQRWINAVTQRLEVAEGARSQWDEVVTRRDLGNELLRVGVVTVAAGRPPGGGGVATVKPDGTVAYVSIESFSESIRTTKLFTDLTRRIDDPARFDDLPERTRALLLEDIAQVRQQADASIRRVDDVIKTATESFAQTVTTVQANISSAAAGVRQVHFASASLNRATAGLVTTITARLDNFTGGAPGTATVESKMTAIADRATGLEAQYVLKVTAGGASAGFGVAATSTTAGTSSAFLIQADKFAIVDSSYSGGFTNTPSAANIMFGVDGDGTYVKGNLKVTGRAFLDGAVTYGGFNASAHFNQARSATHGAAGFTNAAGGYSLVGDGSGGATSNGVGGISAGGFAVYGSASGAGGTGVKAENTGGGTALAVTGLMTINNTTLVTNLNAQYLNGLASSGYCQIIVGNTGTATAAGAGFNLTTSLAGYEFAASGNNVTLQVVSDQRLKQDIQDESLGIAFVRQLRPRTYRMRRDPRFLYHGFIYQEMAEALPREGDALVQHRPEGYGGIDYMSMVAVNTRALQEVDDLVIELRARVRVLERLLAG